MTTKGLASLAFASLFACAGCASRTAPKLADMTPPPAPRAGAAKAKAAAKPAERPDLTNGSADATKAAATDAPAGANVRAESRRPVDRSQAPPATASAFVYSPQQAVAASQPAVGPATSRAEASKNAPSDTQPDSRPGELHISVVASASEITTGAITTVDVMAASNTAVVDAPLHLTFDPHVVEYVDGATGDFLTQGGSSVVFLADGSSRPGDVAIAAGRIERRQGARGSGLLCRVRFRAVASGTTAVQVGQAKAWGTSGEELTVLAGGTSIAVN